MSGPLPIQKQSGVIAHIPDVDPRSKLDEEDTKVPCPVCRTGLVSAEIAQRIRELLERENSDGPSSFSSAPKAVG